MKRWGDILTFSVQLVIYKVKEDARTHKTVHQDILKIDEFDEFCFRFYDNFFYIVNDIYAHIILLRRAIVNIL